MLRYCFGQGCLGPGVITPSSVQIIILRSIGPEQQAEVAVRRAGYAFQIADYQGVIAAAEPAIRWAQAAGHSGHEGRAHLHWGAALLRQGDPATAQVHFEKSLALARAGGLLDMEAIALMRLGQVLDPTPGLGYSEQALLIARKAGDRHTERIALNSVASYCRGLGDLTRSWTLLQQCLALARDTGDSQGEAYALANLGVFVGNLGNYVRARGFHEQALAVAVRIEDRCVTAQELSGLSDVALSLGGCTQACELGEEALRLARDIDDLQAQGFALQSLGAVHGALGSYAASRECYEQALRSWRQMDAPYWAIQSLAGMACADLALGQLGQAQGQVAEILSYLDAGGFLDTDSRPFWIYLTCYRVLAAAGDPRAAEILARAHSELQEWAARIPDEALRRSYLENVAENRDILHEWQLAQAQAENKPQALT